MGGVVQANQFGFNNNLGQALQQGLNLGEQFRANQQRRTQEGLEQQFFAGGGLGQANALQKAGDVGLEFQREVAKNLGVLDKRTGQVDQVKLNDSADFAFSIQNLPIEQQNTAISKRIDDFIEKGGPTVKLRQLLSTPGDQRANELRAVQLAAIPNEKRVKVLFDLAKERGRGGAGSAATATAQMKNLDQLLRLEREGTPEQVTTFRKILGLEKEVKLSSKSEGALIAAQDKSISSGNQARSMDILAADIEKIDIGGGITSTASEMLKQVLGTEEEVSEVRRRFRAIRASQSVNNLPPGPASDKDIALALSGFPAENAGAPAIASFLKGQSKLARIDEAFNIFKADFISENQSVRGLIKAWRVKLNDESFVNRIIGGAAAAVKQDAILNAEEQAELTRLEAKFGNR